MWILTPKQPGGQTCYLLSSKDYVVGRKNCDVILLNDQSISRAHAVLTVTLQTLMIKDMSKYGTFVNTQRLTENTPQELKSGDSITFGVFESKFSVECQRLEVCSSCLDNEAKASLSRVLPPLGGKLVNSWTQDCTHLAMPSVKLTVKTISALLCCRPIVKPEFFSELNKAIEQKSPPPKAESFIPEIDEPSLNKSAVNLRALPARRQLFNGKTFLFLNAKQLKRLSTAVSLGGGRTQLLEEGSLPRNLLESPQSCVLDVISGSSQPLLPSSTAEWANSVKNILQRKGLRVIPESEIGLAAIFASCEKYCNPSCLIIDSDLAQNVKPTIPSASLSQTAAVEETMLAATSQNITAYAANTEPSQEIDPHEVTGMTTVGETPEKRQKEIISPLTESKHGAQKHAMPCVVADTMRSSLSTVEDTDSQWKKPQTRVPGGGSINAASQSSFSKTYSGMKKFPPMHSPQKQKVSAQSSPQKQQTLTSFFQTVSKKRLLEDVESVVTSEAKRALLEDGAPAARAQSPLGSGDDLLVGRSKTEKEPQSKKRKEMEADIDMEELESIMSLDMDCFDEQTSASQSQQTQRKDQKMTLTTTEPLSSSKKQRVHSEGSGRTNQKPQVEVSEASASNSSQSRNGESPIPPFKTQQLSINSQRTNLMSLKLPEKMPPASKDHRLQAFKEEAVSYIEDTDLLKIEIGKPKEETVTLLQPITVKQETTQSDMDEGLGKKLVLVEFRSLTVTAAPRAKPQQTQANCSTENFKRFRKMQVPGTEGALHIIGGSDLSAHNRGTNSDLDEWLKDAAEDERHSKRDESIGDDLFRYNPTKVSRRR